MPARRARRQGAAPRQRLSPDERRRHLLQVAARLMTTRGVDAVQFPEVAAAAGVTRQLVYRFFPSRQALIMAVLEDFAEDLTQRLGRGAAYAMPDNLEAGTRLFVEAVCDTIEAKGAGPWHVLGSKGPDREVARLGEEIQNRLLQPWRARIAETIGESEREAAVVARMIVAGGRAALEEWYDGTLSREEVVRATTRGVSALLKAFVADTRVRAKKAPRR
jgi:AcrR family transcriptional regulator